MGDESVTLQAVQRILDVLAEAVGVVLGKFDACLVEQLADAPDQVRAVSVARYMHKHDGRH